MNKYNAYRCLLTCVTSFESLGPTEAGNTMLFGVFVDIVIRHGTEANITGFQGVTQKTQVPSRTLRTCRLK